MCGRYYIEIDEKELQDIVDEVERNIHESGEQLTFKTSGEFFPTDAAPVQTGSGCYRLMRWGFAGYNGKPVINARSETALEKPMFRQSMLERRCLIPASGYYEWRKDEKKKIKHRLFIPGQPMFFAGCWRQEKDSPLPAFVILTRPAAGAVEAIHDRMPVIIPRNRADVWLNDGPDTMREAIEALSCKPVS